MSFGTIVAFAAVYIVGSAFGFFFGRRMGIDIGSALTFDLLVRMGYVKYHIDERGEVAIEQVGPGTPD